MIKITTLNEGEIKVEDIGSVLKFFFSCTSLSCTGPVVGLIEIPRTILHELKVGPETVTIELAEAVE